MSRTRKPYKTYTKEFKQEAVRMMEESEGDKAFRGRGRPRKEDQSEVATLRSENERLKEDIEIFEAKKRTDLFSGDNQ